MVNAISCKVYNDKGKDWVNRHEQRERATQSKGHVPFLPPPQAGLEQMGSIHGPRQSPQTGRSRSPVTWHPVSACSGGDDETPQTGDFQATVMYCSQLWRTEGQSRGAGVVRGGPIPGRRLLTVPPHGVRAKGALRVSFVRALILIPMMRAPPQRPTS